MLTAADVMTATVSRCRWIGSTKRSLLHESWLSGLPMMNAAGQVPGSVSKGDLIGKAGATGERRRFWWLTLFSDEHALTRDYAKTRGRNLG